MLYSYREWRREDPEYRENMRRIGRSWWMREFGLRRLRIVRAFHPAYRRSHDPFGILTDEAEAVHIKITLGTGWDGGKPTPAEEEFERLLALSDDELDAEIKEQG
jgi:hypothetical protein